MNIKIPGFIPIKNVYTDPRIIYNIYKLIKEVYKDPTQSIGEYICAGASKFVRASVSLNTSLGCTPEMSLSNPVVYFGIGRRVELVG